MFWTRAWPAFLACSAALLGKFPRRIRCTSLPWNFGLVINGCLIFPEQNLLVTVFQLTTSKFTAVYFGLSTLWNPD